MSEIDRIAVLIREAEQMLALIDRCLAVISDQTNQGH